MEMFAPPATENEERRFWIMTMKLTNDNYQTSKGIKVGSSVQEVKDAYPGIKIGLDGRTDPNNCSYVLGDEQQYNYLLFEVKEGTVAEVKVNHFIP